MDSARANVNSDQDRNLPPVPSQLLSRSDMKTQDTKIKTNTKIKISNTNKRLNLPLHNFYQDLIQRDKIHQYKNRCNIDYAYENDIFLNQFLKLMWETDFLCRFTFGITAVCFSCNLTNNTKHEDCYD